ncbi:hypothetical protein GPA00_04040 [Streptococcus equinus]|uniref:hypothetical protein n=1 Tax=Streptococcus equinus TaxID=1335 RepID=UPI0012F8FFC6|nr:hypothetical protein [Streptococcus equinus]QGX46287.1 hypothetical protein GPA00_04040 [Streptococcus equinus]
MIKTRESGGFFSICEQSFTFLFLKIFSKTLYKLKIRAIIKSSKQRKRLRKNIFEVDCFVIRMFKYRANFTFCNKAIGFIEFKESFHEEGI